MINKIKACWSQKLLLAFQSQFSITNFHTKTVQLFHILNFTTMVELQVA